MTHAHRPARVLHLTAVAGGIETYLVMLFAHIDRRRFTPVLVCPPKAESLLERARELGVEVIPTPMLRDIHLRHDVHSLRQLHRVMGEVRPDIVHAHSSKAGVLGRVAAGLRRVPALYTPNAYAFLGASGMRGWTYRLMERAMRPLTTMLVAASDSEATRSRRDVGFAAERVRVFWNSIEMDSPRNRMDTDVGADAARPDGAAPRIMMIGRLAYQKNPEMFVRVAAALVPAIPGARFTVVGAGFHDEHLAQVEALISRLGLTERMEILPWRPRGELLALIDTATVVVVPSRYESFGYVAAEAGARGKPVVATAVDGLRDVVRDGETGFLVELDDDAAMARRIEQLIVDPRLAKRLGQQAHARVRNIFQIEQNIRILEDIYASVLRAAAGAT